MLSATTISVQTPVTETGFAQTIDLSIQDLPVSSTVYLSGSYSINGIGRASFSVNGSLVQVLVNFKSPNETRPGTYTDTITLRACMESPCVSQIAGSPKTITLNYTVVAPVTPPRISLQPANVSLQGFLLDLTSPAQQVVKALFSDMGSIQMPFITLSKTENTIFAMGFNQRNALSDASDISLVLKPPASLGLGTHTDTVTVRACLDQNCVNEVVGSPATATVTYTVVDTVAGPNGYTVKKVAANGNDMVWDSNRGVFYVSIAGASAANANSIGVLDPATGLFSSFKPVPNDPGDLEISPDGQYLYVSLRASNAIQRLSLPSLAADLTIPLGTRPSDGAPLYAHEMHVSPDSPHTVAVVRSTTPVSSDSEVDLAVFDDAVMRGQTVAPVAPAQTGAVSTFQWDTGSRIFGAHTSSTLGTAYQIAVSAGGLAVTASQNGVVSTEGRARLLNGRMYVQTGRIYDPLAFAPLGNFFPGGSFGNTPMTVDGTTGKAFFLTGSYLRTFDLASLTPGPPINLPDTFPNTFSTRLVRWGYDGLAILNPSFGAPSILLLHGPFVRQ